MVTSWNIIQNRPVLTFDMTYLDVLRHDHEYSNIILRQFQLRFWNVVSNGILMLNSDTIHNHSGLPIPKCSNRFCTDS